MRFSIRSLFIVTTLVACALAWPIRSREESLKRRTAYDRLDTSGAILNTSPIPHVGSGCFSFRAGPPIETDQLELLDCDLTEAIELRLWLAELESFPELRILTLPESVSDFDLGNLPALPNLAVLRCRNHRLGEKSIETICERAPNLETLEFVGGRRLSPKSIARIARLPRLVSFTAFDLALNDGHLKQLAAAKNLERLDLSKSQVTFAIDFGAGAFRQLSVVRLAGTKVNDEGILRLSHLPEISEIDLRQTEVRPSGVMAAARIAHEKALSLTFSKSSSPIDDDLLSFEGIEFLVSDDPIEPPGLPE